MTQQSLVVDDEADLLNLFGIVLEMAGFEVSLTTSANQAISKVKEDKPDLILLDVMMPELSGIEVCTIIRDLPLEKQPIIFMYSANDSQENIDRCLEAGADRLISKGIPVDEVTKEIKLVLPTVADGLRVPSNRC